MKRKYWRIAVIGLLATQLCMNVQAVEPSFATQHNPYHILVNKQNPVSHDYVPKDLVMPKVRFNTPGNIEKNYMEREAAYALEMMFQDAKASGVTLIAVSGYRSYDYQNILYTRAIKNYGPNQKGSAPPNESEHRTGLAMDITGLSGGTIQESFGNTKEGKWLAANCYKYGYIIRYPKNKTDITGIIYEPWHVRYVGKELATKLHTSGLTMEELIRCCYEITEMNMELDGTTSIQKVPIINEDGVLYIGLRELGNRIGGTVEYTSRTQMSSLTYGRHYLVAGDNWLNGGGIKTLMINEKLYVPLRKSCEILGLRLVDVDYNGQKLFVQNIEY